MRNVFRNEKHQALFEKDGYVILDVLEANEIELLLDIFSREESNLVKMPFATSNMAGNSELKLGISNTMESIFSKKIAEIFDEYKWFFGSFIYKYPSVNATKGEVAMHQDASLVDEDKFHGINIFCSLGVANKESGALQVVPGSHRLNPYPRGFGQPFPYDHLQDQLFSRLKRIDLNPGQAIIYTTKLFHYSKPNLSTAPRIIAAGIVGPKESTLRYYHVERDSAKKLEIFEVDAQYYLTSPYFQKPDASQYALKEEIPVLWEPLDENKIEEFLPIDA
ncbi:MAG: phytanoyl-CoA dioxygenase family protein [Bacteroidota bacterium]